MHANSGYFEVDLVRRYVDVFEPYDAVVQALRLAPLMRFVRRGGPSPLSRWTTVRDLPNPPRHSFRDWWVKEHEQR